MVTIILVRPVDRAAIFEAARGNVRQYVIESDDTTTPMEFAENSLRFLQCFAY